MANDKILSKSAQSVQDVLSQKGLLFEVVELSSSTRTASDAAATIGCEVVKSLSHCCFVRRKQINLFLFWLACKSCE